MKLEESSQLNRRRFLSALGAAVLLGSAGCSGDDDTEETPPQTTPTETPPPTTPTETPVSTPDPTSSPSPSPTPSDDGQATPTESPDRTTDPWGDIEPTGKPQYTDDPNWRMVGHDLGNTSCNPHAEGPSDDPSIQWVLETSLYPSINNYTFHHPLIVDDTVYTTIPFQRIRDNEEIERWKFVAADAATGETETVFTVDDWLRKPTIVDGTVYVAVGWTVRAYDLASGEERWRTDPSPDAEPNLYNISTIRYVDGVVIVTDNNRLNDSDGNPVPQHYGFDGDTGNMLWKAVGDGKEADGPQIPLIVDGLSLYPRTPTLRDIETGAERVTLPKRLRSPSIHDGELYGVDEGEENVLVSLDWETLDERWTLRSDKRIHAASVMSFDDVLVAGAGEGFLGIDRETGAEVWYTEPADGWDDVDSHLGSVFRPSTQETVYAVHYGGAVTALDPTDGSIEWQLKTDEMDWSIITGCALAEDLLVTVAKKGKMFAIS